MVQNHPNIHWNGQDVLQRCATDILNGIEKAATDFCKALALALASLANIRHKSMKCLRTLIRRPRISCSGSTICPSLTSSRLARQSSSTFTMVRLNISNLVLSHSFVIDIYTSHSPLRRRRHSKHVPRLMVHPPRQDRRTPLRQHPLRIQLPSRPLHRLARHGQRVHVQLDVHTRLS